MGSDKQRRHREGDSAYTSRRDRCQAHTADGRPCGKSAVPGLTVCKTHGGNTVSSARKGKATRVSRETARLWGIDISGSSVSVADELNKLAMNKLTDITAIRIELGKDPSAHYGLLVDSYEESSSDLSGESSKTVHRSGTSPLVGELHKAEQELVQILRLLQEVTGGTEEVDTKRLKMQTAREAARLVKAYPGISVDSVAMEVTRGQ